MRPRIRTIKPELWQDERVGKLSRDARLLLVALVTMADDEGRIRALPAAIIGHAYAYDRDAPRKLPAWIAEIVASGQIVEYEDSGVPYLAFRHWKRHQRINRATASTLPAPPDHRIVVDNSVKPHDSFSEGSVNAHGGIGSDRNGAENNPPNPPQAGGRRGRVRAVTKDGVFDPSKPLDDLERAAFARIGVELPEGATAADAESACEAGA